MGRDSGRERSTRVRPAKAPLSEDAIVSAGLALLAEEGLEAVTMRRVAAALDTGAASLYVYVSGREGLIHAMLHRLTGMIPLDDPDPDRWRDQVHHLLGEIRRVMAEHPGMAAATLGDRLPSDEPVLRLTENLLGLLVAGGVDPQSAGWACDLFVLIVTGTAMEADERGRRRARGGTDGRGADSSPAEIARLFSGLPPDRFPLLVAHAARLVTGDPDQRLHFAVDVVLDGLVARGGRDRQGTPPDPGRDG